MPLIQCPDCGKDVSDAAPACIHCGRPAKKKTQPIIRQPLPSRNAPRPMEMEPVGVTNFRKMEPYTEPLPSSAGCAIASFLIVGLGQLIQKRYWAALAFFGCSMFCGFLVYVFGPLALIGGAIVLVFSVIDAATWDGRRE